MNRTDLDSAAGAVLTIDLDAIARNYGRLAALGGAARCGAVVKADGYGLGAAAVAARLAAADCVDFFVAHLGEVPAVKAAIPADTRVYVLNGLPPGAEPHCRALGAIPVLNTLAEVARWNALGSAEGASLPAALQVDSGMGRLGLSPAEVATLAAEPARLAQVTPTLLMSHLACGDEPGSPANEAQRVAFDALSALQPDIPRSLANSGGVLLGPAYHYDLLRPGIALYGGNPHPGSPNPMEPVVTLTAPLIAVRDIPAGAGVGYGLTDVGDAPRRIGVVSVGYADGWPRHLGGHGGGFIGDHRVAIAGRVSMDSILLDVTTVPDARIGTIVELLGPHQDIDAVARDAGTIAYEILTQLGDRYARRLIGAAANTDGDDA